jgi:hypothetical protein
MIENKWQKSSYSGGEQNDCVEVAEGSEVRHVRDSKDPNGGHFTVPMGSFGAFLEQLKAARS